MARARKREKNIGPVWASAVASPNTELWSVNRELHSIVSIHQTFEIVPSRLQW